MTCNVGGVDRVARTVVGIVLLTVGVAAQIGTGWRIAVLIVAAVALLTAWVRFCPANAILGINSCNTKSDNPA